jgi:eukaryotic-like serine/threonine-protein kinase
VVRRQQVSKRKSISIERARPPSINLNARIVAERFRLDQIVSQSVNGEVHQAFDLKTNSVVAVKLLKSRFMASENFGARLKREFEVLQAIDHPAVVKVIDCGEASDCELYLAMEFIKGVTLENLVKRNGPIKPNKLAMVISQLAGGLDTAHAIGVVHRDVNPANILVHLESEGKTAVKLLDFGLAKLLEPDESQQMNVTGAAMIVGRAEYMAPEQSGGEAVGPATDVYALGLTMFFALTGKPPFSESSEIETLMAQLKKPVPKMSEVNPKVSVSPALEEAVKKALSKREADRYESAGEFAMAFCQAAGAPAPVMSGGAIVERKLKRKKPAKWRTLVGSVASVAAVALVAGLLYVQLKS